MSLLFIYIVQDSRKFVIALTRKEELKTKFDEMGVSKLTVYVYFTLGKSTLGMKDWGMGCHTAQ